MRGLLVAAGLCVGGTSAWADETVGATDCTTSLDAEGSYSTSYTIKGDGYVHFTFVNHNNAGYNWENWYLYCANNDKSTEYFRLRADNCEDKTLSNTNCVSNFDWSNFNTDMNGATVDMYVSRIGSVVSVSNIITTTSDKTYNYCYSYVNTSMSANITVWLGVRLSYLTISAAESYRYNNAYSYDFNSSTHPFTYSSTNSVVMSYPVSINGGEDNKMHLAVFSADRTMSLSYAGNTTFTGVTDYVYEFDWNASSSNGNGNTLTVNGASGTLLTVSQAGNDKPEKTFSANSEKLATHSYASSRDLNDPTAFYHFIFSANATKGVYLTVLYNGTTVVVANQRISDFTTIASIQDVCGKAYHHVVWDDLSLKTAVPTGVVATPTYTITAPVGTSRKFTLECATSNTTIFYATSDLEKENTEWQEYSSEVTTDAATIYAYAKDEDGYTSAKMSFSTGAGTAISLNKPTVAPTSLAIAEDALYYPTVNASYSASGIEFVHVPTLTASFNGSAVSLPYTPTTSGKLIVTASCEGYTSAFEEYDVVGYTKVLWEDYTTLDAIISTGNSSSIRKWSGNNHFELDEGYGIKAIRTDGKAWVQINKAGMIAYEVLSSDHVTSNTYIDVANSNSGNDSFKYFDNGLILSKIYYFTEGMSSTISSAGWATLYTDKALDFSGVSGLTAYTASLSGTTVTLTEVDNVPANTGVVLKADENTYSIPVIASSSTAQGDLLGSVDKATAYDAFSGYTLYMLVLNDDSKAQFVPVTEGEIAAGKAYLKVSNATPARNLNVVFAGESTGISDVKNIVEGAGYYNLNGQRVNQPTKGLYIVNGKKIIMK